MRGAIFIIPAMLLLVQPGFAFEWHNAEFCYPCHQKYSIDQPYAAEIPVPVRPPTVIYRAPCAGLKCHTSNPFYRGPGPHDRWTLHMRICGDCHRALPNSTQLDIHDIHIRFEDLATAGIGGLVLNRQSVRCATCHLQYSGYNNSPVADLPPWDNFFAGNSTILNDSLRVPPWNKDCGYCHPMAKDSVRAHDYHSRVIIEACPVCHGPSILNQDPLVRRIAGRLPEKEAEPEKTSPPSNEFSRLFESIADDIISIYRAFSS